MKSYWRDRYQAIPGASGGDRRAGHRWCEQILTEVVLAGQGTTWTAEQFDALLLPAALTAALPP